MIFCLSKESVLMNGYLKWKMNRQEYRDSQQQQMRTLGNNQKHMNQVDDGILQWIFKKLPYHPKDNVHTLLNDLKLCSIKRDIQWGRRIHAEAANSRHGSNIYVATALVRMYAKCGNMVEARRIFDSTHNPDVICWNVLLLAYAETGNGLATLELFSKMKACGCAPDSMTYVSALKACTSLAEKLDGDVQGWCLNRGREIHAEIGCNLDILVQSTLIDMYANVGSMVDARQVFESIQNPDVVSWNALLMGYAENEEGHTTLELFSRMNDCGCALDSVTYIAVLKACGLIGDLALGRKLHSDISEYNAHVVTCLIDFYAKCGSMVEAFEVFELHSTARVVPTWNALLAGYGSFGDTDSVFNLFEAMKDEGFQPDSVTFLCILSCCSRAGLVKKAREYFEAMPVQYGVTPTVTHFNSMVDILGRANRLSEALAIIRRMPYTPDEVTWKTLLGACCRWKNVQIGRCAFQCLLDMDKKNAYVLTDMLEEQERVLETQRRGRMLLGYQQWHFFSSSFSGFCIMLSPDKGGTGKTRKTPTSIADGQGAWGMGSSQAATVLFQLHAEPNMFEYGKHKGRNINHLVWECNPWWKTAVDALGKLKLEQPAKYNVHNLLSDLKCCTRNRDLQEGRRVHANAVESGNDSNMFVLSALINMYSKCGSMKDARRVFDEIEEPNVVCWNTLILGYADNGEGLAALDSLSRMKTVRPNSVTYVGALKACTSLAVHGDVIRKAECLERGRQIHLRIAEHMNHFVQNTLIDMYSKCGSMIDARRVFDSVQKPDVVSWNALIMGHASNGEGRAALENFSMMRTARGCAPDAVTYVAVIKACTSLSAYEDEVGKRECLKLGREIHLEIGQHMDHFVKSTLINMYAKFGSMNDAQNVFDSTKEPNVVCWTSLILGYVDNEEAQVALNKFFRMKNTHGCVPNTVTYVAAIKACSSLAVHGDDCKKRKVLECAKEIHSEIDCHSIHLQNTLVDMYSKCGSMRDARKVFESIQKPDVVSWNSLIMGYADNGEGQVALDLFSRMKTVRGCAPNSVTYVAVIKACASLAVDGDDARREDYLERGRDIHSEIGNHMDHFVQSALINMYANLRSMLEAQEVFDSIEKPNVVSWTALILGYAENGEGQTALDIFSKMKTTCGCAPNSVTYVAAIKACTSLAGHGDESMKQECLEWGRQIHSEIGNHMNHFVQSTLIDMYSKCNSMEDAKLVFDNIKKPDLVSWNALILGYANNEGQTALDLFSRMQSLGNCTPDSMTFVAVLKACSSIGALDIGHKVHSNITDFTVHVVTCLVDFYAKCGSIKEARQVFDSHSSTRDITTWNALLAGYGSFGDTDSVFKLFEAMQDEGFKPDAVTLLCMLSCCGHAGLVEKAREYLETMPLRYGVTPNEMHNNCMIDVLCRANQLNEAVGLMQTTLPNTDAVTWMGVLSACRKWKNVEVGRLAFRSMMHLNEKKNATASAYVIMAQIYASRGMQDEQEQVLEAWKAEERNREETKQRTTKN